MKENHSNSSMAFELFVPLSPPKGVPVFSEVVMNSGHEHGRRGMSNILFGQSLSWQYEILFFLKSNACGWLDFEMPSSTIYNSTCLWVTWKECVLLFLLCSIGCLTQRQWPMCICWADAKSKSLHWTELHLSCNRHVKNFTVFYFKLINKSIRKHKCCIKIHDSTKI